jgi:hypothetical protein
MQNESELCLRDFLVASEMIKMISSFSISPTRPAARFFSINAFFAR